MSLVFLDVQRRGVDCARGRVAGSPLRASSVLKWHGQRPLVRRLQDAMRQRGFAGTHHCQQHMQCRHGLIPADGGGCDGWMIYIRATASAVYVFVQTALLQTLEALQVVSSILDKSFCVLETCATTRCALSACSCLIGRMIATATITTTTTSSDLVITYRSPQISPRIPTPPNIQNILQLLNIAAGSSHAAAPS